MSAERRPRRLPVFDDGADYVTRPSYRRTVFLIVAIVVVLVAAWAFR